MDSDTTEKKVYLVTGYAGVGKTTLRKLMNPGVVVSVEQGSYVAVSQVYAALLNEYSVDNTIVVESVSYPDELYYGLKEVAQAAGASFRHVQIRND